MCKLPAGIAAALMKSAQEHSPGAALTTAVRVVIDSRCLAFPPRVAASRKARALPSRPRVSLPGPRFHRGFPQTAEALSCCATSQSDVASRSQGRPWRRKGNSAWTRSQLHTPADPALLDIARREIARAFSSLSSQRPRTLAVAWIVDSRGREGSPLTLGSRR